MTTERAALPTRARASKLSPALRPAAKKIATVSAIAAACHTAADGFDLVVQCSKGETTRVAAKNAGEALRALALEMNAPRSRMRDRLRWEWLASTAKVLDGDPDHRLLAECARILGDAVALMARVEPKLPDAIVAKVRLASAEAFSLSLATASRTSIPARSIAPAI